jgi:dTDP-4-dehydrorhamnose reductase
MKVIVLGSGGQVGFELMRAVWPAETELVGLSRDALDVSDDAAVHRALAALRPTVVVNAAAYTAVDRAEGEAARAFAVNDAGPGHVARACAETGAALIHYSTDYVFDGTKRGAYGEDDPVAPLGVYGRSKEAGERRVRELCPAHLILRTSWVFGAHGHNFVKTILRLASEREELWVVADQTGCPTGAAGLAGATVACVRALAGGDQASGTYHIAGAPATTWYGFAAAILEIATTLTGRASPRLVPITTADYPTPARRPANSTFDCSRIAERLGIAQPAWRDELTSVVSQLLAA